MKKFFTILTILMVVSLSAQLKVSTKIPGVNTTVSYSIPSNKTFNLDVKKPKTEQQQIGKATTTSNKAVYKGNNYPVYVTNKGKLFIVHLNKEGNSYSKKYIKEENL